MANSQKWRIGRGPIPTIHRVRDWNLLSSEQQEEESNDHKDLTKVDKNALMDHLWPKSFWAEKKRREVTKNKEGQKVSDSI